MSVFLVHYILYGNSEFLLPMLATMVAAIKKSSEVMEVATTRGGLNLFSCKGEYLDSA